MKRGLNIIIAISIILCISMIKPPQKVLAKDTKVAEGVWNTGTEVEVDATVPASLNLLTKGVEITAPQKICHPFNGGRFGWVGEIRQLIKGNWIKLATTNEWFPDTEGVYMACAQAPAAGTYALFGYWIRPAGYVEESSVANLVLCPDTSGWRGYRAIVPPDPWHFILETDNLPGGLPVTMEILDPVDSNYVGPKTGSSTTGAIPPIFWAVFWDAPFSLIDRDLGFNSTIRFTFPSLNCYWDADYSN